MDRGAVTLPSATMVMLITYRIVIYTTLTAIIAMYMLSRLAKPTLITAAL